jgi:hypothetical protein
MSCQTISNNNTPEIYSTSNIPCEEKIITEAWTILGMSCYWLICKKDTEQGLGFGFACLSGEPDDGISEWGYVSLLEIEQCNAIKIPFWIPCTFQEAKRNILKFQP